MRSLANKVPLSRWSIIKLLLVLAYTQMLIQQMDNRQLVDQELRLLSSSLSNADSALSGCCKQDSSATGISNQEGALASTADWFQCMWTSAQGCSARLQGTGAKETSRAARLLSFLVELSGQAIAALLAALHWLYKRLANLDGFLFSVNQVWLARWRSPIVQRLCQSMAFQLGYVAHLMLSTGADADVGQAW